MPVKKSFTNCYGETIAVSGRKLSEISSKGIKMTIFASIKEAYKAFNNLEQVYVKRNYTTNRKW